MSKLWRTVSLAAMVLTFGTFAAAEEPTPPPFKFEFKRTDDRAVAKIEEGKATITIDSPVGISRATVERTGDAWPESVTLRLNLRGLEHFSASSGEAKIEASVASTDVAPRVRCWKAGAEETPLAPTDPLWLEVRLLTKKNEGANGTEIKELPAAGGCFEIRLPKALFEKNPKTIELEWIDFYRG